MDVDFVVMTTSFGKRDISHLIEAIPNLIICTDYRGDAMGNFINSLMASDKPCVHLEDDIDICDDFVDKIKQAISCHPNRVINFFSLRKKGYELKRPYEETGSKYLMNQCFYLPCGYGQQIAEFYKGWERKKEHPTGLDLLIADFLKSRKERYIQWFPHLVNHKQCRSLINPRRSSKRNDKNQIKSI